MKKQREHDWVKQNVPAEWWGVVGCGRWIRCRTCGLICIERYVTPRLGWETTDKKAQGPCPGPPSGPQQYGSEMLKPT